MGLKRRMTGIVASAAVMVGFVGFFHAQQQPVLRVSNYSVAVDVVVTDGGNRHVTDLNQEDFMILEDGVPQKIESLQAIFPGRGDDSRSPELQETGRGSSGGRGGENMVSPPVSPAGPNLVILLLDYATVEYLNQKYVRDAAIKYVREKLKPNDLMAVFQVGMGLRFLQGFTNDREALVEALSHRSTAGTAYSTDQASLVQGAERSQDDVEMLSASLDALASASSSPGANVAQVIALLESQMERAQAIEGLYYSQLSYSREQQSRPVIGAVQTIADGVSHISGRKTLILFSEGFSVPLTLEKSLYRAVERANRANLAVYAVDAGGLRVKYGSTEGELFDISAGRSGDRVKAYGGLSQFDRAREIGSDQKDSTLRFISTATGGFLIRNTNDFSKALERIDDEIRSHYVLTYQPANLNFDGGFRRITVQVARPGLKVRSRSGYWAVPAGASVLSADEFGRLIRLESARTEREKNVNSFPVFAQTSHFLNQQGTYDVELTVEIPATAAIPQAVEGRTFIHPQVLGIVQDEYGNTVSSLRGPSRIAVEPAKLREDGYLRMANFLRLRPGRYSLLVECSDAVGGGSGYLRRSLWLPQPDPGIALSSLVVGESLSSVKPGDSSPLTVNDVRILPSARRRFAEGDRLIYFLKIFDPGLQKQTPKVELKMSLFHRGRRIRSSSETLDPGSLDLNPFPNMALARYLELEGLPPGRYLLRAEVMDKVRNQKLSTQTSFDVARR